MVCSAGSPQPHGQHAIHQPVLILFHFWPQLLPEPLARLGTLECAPQPRRKVEVAVSTSCIQVVADASSSVRSPAGKAEVSATAAHDMVAALLLAGKREACWAGLTVLHHPARCCAVLLGCVVDSLPEPLLARLLPQLLPDFQNLSLGARLLDVLLKQVVLASNAWTSDVASSLAQNLDLDVLREARQADIVAVASACGVAPAMIGRCGIDYLCAARRGNLQADRAGLFGHGG
mmetsp:Transcript_34274/g.80104  ORF Transcript_34274/g.80104 Transcript_34274/m.80104 type:complete len:233 (+) Transcript_34274:561-1259(+)